MHHRLQSVQSWRHPMREGIGAALFACALALSAMPAAAQSLNDALAGAYQTNPVLQAARAQLRATDELVPEALSGWRPTVNAEAAAGAGIDNDHDDGRLLGLAQLRITQPIYSGGRTGAAVNQAEKLVQASAPSWSRPSSRCCCNPSPPTWMWCGPNPC
jgi:outer membrane protein TolC